MVNKHMSDSKSLNISDEEFERYSKLRSKVCREHPEAFDEIWAILHDLALDGLWRGFDYCFLRVAELKYGEKYL